MRFVIFAAVASACAASAQFNWTESDLDRAVSIYPSLKNRTRAAQFMRVLSQAPVRDPASMVGETPITPFPCKPAVAPSRPTSVHELRIGDFEAVAALGDSLTAGFGALSWSMLTLFQDWRGVSFSVGGDETSASMLTLPNMMRVFNPKVIGFSTYKGDIDSADAQLNRAVTGAIAVDLVPQARDLVGKMKAILPADVLANGWKLVTIFIGGNDLCDWCNVPAEHDYQVYAANLKAAIEYIRANTKRVFVNVVTVIDVTQLACLDSTFCSLIHPFECECGDGPQSALDAVEAEARRWHSVSYQVAQQYEAMDDFQVVVQPFMSNSTVPKLADGTPDYSYFAVDCFHFSGKGHQAASTALWNNIFEPVGKKEQSYQAEEKELTCPDASMLVATAQNSKHGARAKPRA